MTGRPPRRRRRWRTRAGRKSRRISNFTPPFYWQTGVFRSRGGGEKKALSRNALKYQPPGITCQDKQDQYYFSLLISCGAFPVRHSFPGSKDASSPRATRHQKSSYRKLVIFFKKRMTIWVVLRCMFGSTCMRETTLNFQQAAASKKSKEKFCKEFHVVSRILPFSRKNTQKA